MTKLRCLNIRYNLDKFVAFVAEVICNTVGICPPVYDLGVGDG